nr:MAG TPA: hypothetical protein [Caudoviricetes sp.]
MKEEYPSSQTLVQDEGSKRFLCEDKRYVCH